jgi:hypothetical protein
MSIVCIHVPDSVTFSTPKHVSLREESERHKKDRIRCRRGWQCGNNGLMKEAARPSGVMEPVRGSRNIVAQIS